MSRAGRAVPEEAAPSAPAVPPDVLERVERHARAERLFMACKVAIIERYPPLWPPDIVGASIAEQWMQNVVARLAQQRTAAHRVHVANAELAATAGLVLPA